MAAKAVSSVIEWMGLVTRVREEAERLVATVARDMQGLASRGRADLAADVRRFRQDVQQRADGALRTLEARGARVVSGFEQQLARAGTLMLRRISAATQAEIDTLDRRIAELEKRLEQVARKGRSRRGPGARGRRSRRVAS